MQFLYARLRVRDPSFSARPREPIFHKFIMSHILPDSFRGAERVYLSAVRACVHACCVRDRAIFQRLLLTGHLRPSSRSSRFAPGIAQRAARRRAAVEVPHPAVSTHRRTTPRSTRSSLPELRDTCCRARPRRPPTTILAAAQQHAESSLGS